MLAALVACAPAASERVLPAVVERHVDGDTFDVTVDDSRERVRFIGIDTPERGMPGFGKASAFTAKAAPLGARVFLELDIDERDRYGRLLAYVWLVRDGDAERDMLNARLITQGHALPLTIPPNVEYADLFARLSRSYGDP